MSPRTVAARVEVPDAGTVAVGFAVLERGWCGVFGMATRAAARRTGAASAILHAFATEGLAAGAPSMYLQVEEDNAPARTLYARAGFATSYRYHYRTLL
ncbi:MAG: GNAT family N-acetyltransferase [Thermodesulfobacteriota bacterium]